MTNSNNGLLVRTGIFVASWLATVALAGCSGTVTQETGDETAGGGSNSTKSRHASCANQTPGADHHCGLNQDLDCCADLPVPGGSFNRYNNPKWPATVSDFRLGMVEVTVGRIRAFVNTWPDAWPKPGDGANPHVPGSGWKEDWDQYLPKTREELVGQLRCDGLVSYPPHNHQEWATWTDEVGPHEDDAAGCVSWFVAFSFCVWDSGRLPTEAEMEYVIVGGDQQRPYPWGTAAPSPNKAVARFPGDGPFIPVGSRPDGAARWGHLDLGGGFTEWGADSLEFDAQGNVSDIPLPCHDCQDTGRKLRVGTDHPWIHSLAPHDAKYRGGAEPGYRSEPLGFRCAYPVNP